MNKTTKERRKERRSEINTSDVLWPYTVQDKSEFSVFKALLDESFGLSTFGERKDGRLRWSCTSCIAAAKREGRGGLGSARRERGTRGIPRFPPLRLPRMLVVY